MLSCSPDFLISHPDSKSSENMVDANFQIYPVCDHFSLLHLFYPSSSCLLLLFRLLDDKQKCLLNGFPCFYSCPIQSNLIIAPTGSILKYVRLCPFSAKVSSLDAYNKILSSMSCRASHVPALGLSCLLSFRCPPCFSHIGFLAVPHTFQAPLISGSFLLAREALPSDIFLGLSLE